MRSLYGPNDVEAVGKRKNIFWHQAPLNSFHRNEQGSTSDTDQLDGTKFYTQHLLLQVLVQSQRLELIFQLCEWFGRGLIEKKSHQTVICYTFD